MEYSVENLKNSVFENIKRINAIGQEFWSGRELFKALDYNKWEKFINIDKAKEVCSNCGQEIADHFPRVEKTVEIGSGAKRDIGDLHLTPIRLLFNYTKCRPKQRSCCFRSNLFCYTNTQTRTCRARI
jgi:hypothetical protein